LSTRDEVTFDEYDEQVNPRPEDCEFDRVMEVALSRRDLLKSVVAFGSVAALGASWTLDEAVASTDRFAFTAIAANTSDDITVPEGYNATVVTRWGDPLWSNSVEFDHDTRGTGESQALSFGDNIDGMDMFSHEGHALLVVNNEYTNRKLIWGNRPDGAAETDDDVLKGKMASGSRARFSKNRGRP